VWALPTPTHARCSFFELSSENWQVQKALKAQYDFMRIVAACKRPTDHVLALLLQVPPPGRIYVE